MVKQNAARSGCNNSLAICSLRAPRAHWNVLSEKYTTVANKKG